MLLIHSPTEGTMRFVATEGSCVGSNLCKHLLTQILAVGVVWWVQFLGHRYFEGMKIQIEMQDPPQTAVRHPQGNSMSWRVLDRCSHSCTVSAVLMDLRRPCVRLLSVLPHSSNCLTNPGTNCVPIRNSIVARNVEPSPKSSLRRDYWSVVFKIHAHGKATMCSGPNRVAYWNGVTDRAEGDRVHRPTPTAARVFAPPNRLICSATPCI
jgi:hypothetical protein